MEFMFSKITLEDVKKLSVFPDLDIPGVQLPEWVYKIKDLSNYIPDEIENNAIYHNQYVIWLHNGDAVGISMPQEAIPTVLAEIGEQLKKEQQ